MKIYTRKGDLGQTSLFSGRRTGKSDARIAAVGDLDELSASLGIARLAFPPAAADIRAIQHDLYAISAVLSAEGKREGVMFAAAEAGRLEAIIDRVSEALPELREFIYPGESEPSARLHVARAVARRAERGIAALDDPACPPEILAYLNRLSDLLFVWARDADRQGGLASSELRSKG